MEVKGERGTESQNRGQRTCACRNCLKQSGTYRYFGSLMLSTQERGQPAVFTAQHIGNLSRLGWWPVFFLRGLHRNLKSSPPHRVGTLMAGGDCGRKAAAVPHDGRDSTSAWGGGCQPTQPDQPPGAAALRPRAHPSPICHLTSLSISYQFAFNWPQHSIPPAVSQPAIHWAPAPGRRVGIQKQRDTKLGQLGVAGMKSQPKVATARCQGSGSDRVFYRNMEEEGVPGGWWALEAFSELSWYDL